MRRRGRSEEEGRGKRGCGQGGQGRSIQDPLKFSALSKLERVLQWTSFLLRCCAAALLSWLGGGGCRRQLDNLFTRHRVFILGAVTAHR